MPKRTGTSGTAIRRAVCTGCQGNRKQLASEEKRQKTRREEYAAYEKQQQQEQKQREKRKQVMAENRQRLAGWKEKTDVFCTAERKIEEILKAAAEDQKADAGQLQTAKDRLGTFQQEPEKEERLQQLMLAALECEKALEQEKIKFRYVKRALQNKKNGKL